MPDLLSEIVAHKRDEISRARRERPVDELRRMPGFALRPRNFFGAVSAPRRRPNLIAEIKAASPSAGVLAERFDPVAAARAYEQAGAAAISVLTDERYFRGRLEHLARVKSAVHLPVLRKDFILDEYQLVESRAFEADAVLLIGEALEPGRLAAMAAEALALDLSVLIEVHEKATLTALLQRLDWRRDNAVLLGVNNRDLRTQTIDLSVTETLAPHVPPGLPLVSESGVRCRADVERLARCGARALLVGEALMRSADPARTIEALFG